MDGYNKAFIRQAIMVTSIYLGSGDPGESVLRFSCFCSKHFSG